MGISILIPLTSDRIPKSTLSSVLNQRGLCVNSTDLNSGVDEIPYEIIILQNGVSTIQDGLEVREIQLPICYVNIPLRKLQIRSKGKGNALNIGIGHARYEYICVLDADCILDEDAICIAMRHFKDKNISVVGGRLKTMSEKKNIFTFYQKIEYMRSFNVWRPLFDVMNADCLISGAYGIFRRSYIERVQGYANDTVGEDMDLVLAIQQMFRKDGRCVCYEKDSLCYTSVPTTMQRLLHQRDRWQRGLMECLIKHKNLIFNPRYGFLGLVVMPYQVLVELLGPVFILLNCVNLICAVGDIKCWFALVESLKYWLSGELGIRLQEIWNFYPIYLGIEVGLTCLAAWIEYDRWQVLAMKLPGAIAATGLGIILSVPLAMARFWGMVSCRWRRMQW